MRKPIDSKEWAEDFQIFLQSKESNPPPRVTEQIFLKVNGDLNPLSWAVFTKLTLVQACVGLVTLLFCPQFGISLFSGMGLTSVFMQLGETACMAACGGVFLGAGSFVGALILKPEEVKVIRRNKVLQLALLGSLSMGAFICLGAPVIMTLGLVWLLGSTLGGIATLELGWLIRSQFRRKMIYSL